MESIFNFGTIMTSFVTPTADDVTPHRQLEDFGSGSVTSNNFGTAEAIVQEENLFLEQAEILEKAISKIEMKNELAAFDVTTTSTQFCNSKSRKRQSSYDDDKLFLLLAAELAKLKDELIFHPEIEMQNKAATPNRLNSMKIQAKSEVQFKKEHQKRKTPCQHKNCQKRHVRNPQQDRFWAAKMIRPDVSMPSLYSNSAVQMAEPQNAIHIFHSFSTSEQFQQQFPFFPTFDQIDPQSSSLQSQIKILQQYFQSPHFPQQIDPVDNFHVPPVKEIYSIPQGFHVIH
ncbi:uncharacterized protein LOC127286548 [Leptopilina boulardi]|uniref:uncharacterized protein LOC127286548 n=1 Tax=Leptopilina boulardi TaxID=63433 RepID=UPI0021F54BFA|nr:uncharacterized protein LOC127286548 [Leptopilina boulardi]XP_051168966.1 uncharacterized protein LOC127286548 [Leptopilina boulardi]XP_051168967.1 uncharacterized protein LOC127286548 [Leptopilina boulardi]